MKLISIRHASIPDPKSSLSPQTIPLPERVILSLASPWGEASATVQKGEKVQAGQCVARSADPLVPPVSASISGTVRDIKPCLNHLGKESLSIVIESSGEESAGSTSPVQAPASDPAHMLHALLAAGIQEVDPHAWPLAFRIASPELVAAALPSPPPPLLQPIETLIVNGIDRQPGVYVRRAVFGYGENLLLDAIAALQRLSGASRTVLAVTGEQVLSEEFQKDALNQGIELLRCPNRYPLALEPLLAQFVTKKEVPQPANDTRLVNTAIVDVVTATHIAELLHAGVAPTETVLQVDAPAHGLGQVVRARRGMLLEDLMQHLPSLPDKPAKVIVGGLFLGSAQHALQVPVTHETDAVTLQTPGELQRSKNDACFNCGNCVRYCPMNLLPNELGKYCEYGKFDDAERNFLFHCIECGICGYVCPARRPMVQLLRFGKNELSAMREAS